MLASAVLAAGCFSVNYGEGQIACSLDGRCPPGLRCASDGLCRRADIPVPDSKVDAGIDIVADSGPVDMPPDAGTGPGADAGNDEEEPVFVDFSPSNIDKSLLAAGNGPFHITAEIGDVIIDTSLQAVIRVSDGSALDLPGVVFTNVPQPQPAPPLWVMSTTDLTIAKGVTVQGRGAAALVITASGNMDIQGFIDVSGGLLDAGPGGSPGGQQPGSPGVGLGGGQPCPNASSLRECGGGGGGYGAPGGAGGRDDNAQSPGGNVYGSTELSPLVGGSGGASGGDNDAGFGGGGGGALQLSARGRIIIGASAGINAGGGGGEGGGDGTSDPGGGGGGSGGSILLEATQIALSGTLAANGGGGGAGGLDGAPGPDGTRAELSATAAAGGAGHVDGNGPKRGGGGAGGAGNQAEGSAGQARFDNGGFEVGGGGGGGGGGRLFLRARDFFPTAATIVSPQAGLEMGSL